MGCVNAKPKKGIRISVNHERRQESIQSSKEGGSLFLIREVSARHEESLFQSRRQSHQVE